MKKQLIIFTLALLFFIIANAPATLLTPYIKNIQDFHIKEVKGSIWQGSIVSNQLGVTSWNINPFYLLAGTLSADTSIQFNQSNHLNSSVSVNLFQKIKLENISGALTTDYIQQLAPTLPIMAKANLIVSNAQVHWDDKTKNLGRPSFAKGDINIQKVNFLGEQLGSYDARFSYKNNLLNASISSNQSSQIDTDIKLTLDSKFRLTVKGAIQPKTNNIVLIFKELNISNTQDYSIQL